MKYRTTGLLAGLLSTAVVAIAQGLSVMDGEESPAPIPRIDHCSIPDASAHASIGECYFFQTMMKAPPSLMTFSQLIAAAYRR